MLIISRIDLLIYLSPLSFMNKHVHSAIGAVQIGFQGGGWCKVRCRYSDCIQLSSLPSDDVTFAVGKLAMLPAVSKHYMQEYLLNNDGIFLPSDIAAI